MVRNEKNTRAPAPGLPYSPQPSATSIAHRDAALTSLTDIPEHP